MRIDDMECFRVLAETLSYTNAANRLYLTQSSLTRTIQQMEEELGFQLFDRSRRTVALTAAGQSFYQNCEAILNSYYETVEKARYAQEGNNGLIRFATHVYSVNTVVFDILGEFQAEHPDILLKISSSDTEHMIHDLNEGKIDCAVCTGLTGVFSAVRMTSAASSSTVPYSESTAEISSASAVRESRKLSS